MPHISLLTPTLPSTLHFPQSHTISLIFHPLTLPNISLLTPLPNYPPLPLIIPIKLRIQRLSESLDIPKVMKNLPITIDNAIFESAATAGRRRRVQHFPGMGALPGFASFEDDEQGV
jgi:hypothetical protein